MDCTSVATKVPGLRTRLPAGLRRPTKEIPGLGTIEQLREERCHCWQLTHQFVPTRITVIDEIVADPIDAPQAIEFLSSLVTLERPLRERLIRAIYFQFNPPEVVDLEFDAIVGHLDDWMSPYRINCWGSKGSFTIKYDCSDAPHRQLLRSAQIDVSVDRSWTITGLHCFTAGLADDLRIAAYRQRVIPESCGFVKDSIADQFIVNSYIKPNDELAALLSQSIEQTTHLYEQATKEHKAFLSQAVDLLHHARAKNFDGK